MRIQSALKKILGYKSIKNGMWMYLLQIFNTVIPLLTLPYITRILGKEQYGAFSIALNIIGYLQVLIEYGFGMSATRKVALTNGDKKTVSSIFSSVLFSRLILLCLSIFITLGYVWFIRDNPRQWQCVIVLSICLIGFCFQQDWLFQGLQDMKYISILSIIARLISVILIFLLVKSADDLLLYCIFYAVSPLLSGLIGTAIAFMKYKLKIVLKSPSDILHELKDGWYVFTTSLSAKIFGGIGITFLGLFSTEAVVGAYSAIQKIPQLMMLAWMPISQVMYPIISKRMMQSFTEGEVFVNKLRKIFLLPFLLMAIFICLFAKIIVGVAFGQEYIGNYYWILPLMIWVILGINNNFLGIQTLLSSGYDKEYSQCFQLGVICTILFNLILILIFDGNGAAIAPAISEAVLAVALHFQIKRVKKRMI